MAQVVFNQVGGKPPFFDSTCYDYWKRKMRMYLGSINDEVCEVTENDYAIIDPDDPTNQDNINITLNSNTCQYHGHFQQKQNRGDILGVPCPMV